MARHALHGAGRPSPASSPSEPTPKAALAASDNASSPELTGDADEALWDRVTTQWQFGDWLSLLGVTRQRIEGHSHRARIALLVGVAHQQSGDLGKAKEFIDLARFWGCSKSELARVLIAGTYNSLGRLTVLMDRGHEAVGFFEKAVAIGSPSGDRRLLTRARILEQASQLHATSSAVTLKLDYEKDSGVALIPRLSRERTRPTLPGSETQEPSGQEPLVLYFRVEIDGKARNMPFRPSNPEGLHLEGDELLFDLPAGKPVYLVSNDTGNFNLSPLANQLPLEPDTAYSMSGVVPSTGGEPPQVWAFQYGGGQRLHSTSLPASAGHFNGSFSTYANTSRFALGIRLSGQGRLKLGDVRIQLKVDPVAAVSEAIKAETQNLSRQLMELQDSLEKRQAKQNQNTLTQLEAFIRLQTYMGQDFVIPDVHGWPVSPDFAVLLIHLIEADGYDAVIEFGSGVSTVIVAKALVTVAQRDHSTPALFLSFDHLDKYYNQTAALLNRARLRDNVDLRLAPLVETVLADATSYPYYTCQRALAEFQGRLTQTWPKILVIVDGPPAATGPKARYPALPVLWQSFGGAADIDMLLDDYIRADERKVIEGWQSFLAESKATVDKIEYPNLEKQACLLKIRIAT